MACCRQARSHYRNQGGHDAMWRQWAAMSHEWYHLVSKMYSRSKRTVQSFKSMSVKKGRKAKNMNFINSASNNHRYSVFTPKYISMKVRNLDKLVTISVLTDKSLKIPLHWRHNDHDGVSNHQPHGCLLNRLFRRTSKKTSKLRVTGLYVRNSPGPVNSPHKGLVKRKIFPFDDIIMLNGFQSYLITAVTKNVLHYQLFSVTNTVKILLK